jgi:hypothetical protein
MPEWNRHVTAELLAFHEATLPSARAAEIRTHVNACVRCTLDLELIRSARQVLSFELGIHPVPRRLADGIRDAVLSFDRAPSSAIGLISPAFVARSRPASLSGWLLAATAALAVVVFGWWMGRPWITVREVADAAPPFERAARTLHEQAAHGGIALDFKSSSAESIRDWLRDRGAPAPELTGQPPGGAPEIVPLGASVARLRNGSASLVRYEVDGHPVTLMAAPTATTEVPARSWPLSKQVTHRRDAGVGALSWMRGDQTFVLVSDLPGRGLQACLLCHVDARFRHALSNF